MASFKNPSSRRSFCTQSLSPAYLFSKPINWLDFDPSYPKEPKTFGEYIRKWRMEKGISQVELAKTLGVNEMTIVNWEIKRMVPRIRSVRERLVKEIPGWGAG